MLASFALEAPPGLVVLCVFCLCATWVHLRGRERLGLLRQLTDHSTLMGPYNAFVCLFSKVPRRPVLDADDLPHLRTLREHWREIRDEALALDAGGRIRPSARHDDVAFNSFFRRGWSRFYLEWYGGFFASALEHCPRTVQLLRSVPQVKAAMFVLLPPRSRLGRHRDPFAGCLRYHLGLSTPNSDACSIWIDGRRRSWRDGEALLFDETYVHWAENATDEPRIILFCDVERPLRFVAPAWINRTLGYGMVRLARARNEDGERVGVLNVLFGLLHGIRRAGRRLKRSDRRLYYAVKYALLAVMIWLVFL